MEIQGKILQIGETESFGATNFRKRQLVVETEEQYKQKIPIDFVQDKTSLLDNYKVGQDVKVSINIRGNEYNGKFYSSIQGWRIEMPNVQTPNPLGPIPQPFEPVGSLNEMDDSGLPF